MLRFDLGAGLLQDLAATSEQDHVESAPRRFAGEGPADAHRGPGDEGPWPVALAEVLVGHGTPLVWCDAELRNI